MYRKKSIYGAPYYLKFQASLGILECIIQNTTVVTFPCSHESKWVTTTCDNVSESHNNIKGKLARHRGLHDM